MLIFGQIRRQEEGWGWVEGGGGGGGGRWTLSSSKKLLTRRLSPSGYLPASTHFLGIFGHRTILSAAHLQLGPSNGCSTSCSKATRESTDKIHAVNVKINEIQIVKCITDMFVFSSLLSVRCIQIESGVLECKLFDPLGRFYYIGASPRLLLGMNGSRQSLKCICGDLQI